MAAAGPRMNGHATKRRKLSPGPEEYPSTTSDRPHTGPSKHSAKTDSPAASAKAQDARSSHSDVSVRPLGGFNRASILALQVADLTHDVTPNYEKLRSKWSGLATQLEALINHLPARPSMSATEALRSFRKLAIEIPFPHPPPSAETNYKFECQPPEAILIGGALPLGLSIIKDRVVEMTVVMPQRLLQEKDCLNHRAFHKAAFYLACIAAAIKERHDAALTASFAHQDGLDLTPVLEVTSTDKELSNFRFHIAIGFPEVSIPVAKTAPTKRCLRQERRLAAPEDSSSPTPFYNSCIRHAASLATFADMIQSVRSPAFDDACRIGQLWLRHRGFSSAMSSGGFGFLEWALICALFLRGGGHRGQPLFSKQYSGLQFFKAMLQLLGGRDFRDAMILGGASFTLPHSECPTLFDAGTGVNILFKMMPWSYEALRQHAQTSLAAINASDDDNADATFNLDVTAPMLRFDDILAVDLLGSKIDTTIGERELLETLHRVLVRGLGDRASLVDLTIQHSPKWALAKAAAPSPRAYQIEVRMLTNAENAARLVDHGPPADDEAQCRDFRQFWGDKAELRRFKDGSISESLVWQKELPVPFQIVRHLTALHFPAAVASVARKSTSLDAIILGDGSAIKAKNAFQLVDSTFQTLTSTLHGLQDLPLPIRSVLPADPALRLAALDHPLLPQTTAPINIVLQFDSSARWPDSLAATQHTKVAFLLKVGELLTAAKSDVTTRVGLEPAPSTTAGPVNASFLDIIYPAPSPGLSPICFRARIRHEREAHLLQATLADKALHGAVRDLLGAALVTHQRDFHAGPMHTTAIRNLCMHFPPLSDTIRLLKRWVSAHLLLPHVPEEVLEIVASKVFLRPSPWPKPGTSTTAFLRCLHFLSRWDWASTPLLVDMSLAQDMATPQMGEMDTRFRAWRKLDPNMNKVVWFVGTNVDPTGTSWTQGSSPPRVVAGRLTALARAAIDVVETKGTRMADADWASLFSSPTSDFDFQIHLKSAVCRTDLSKVNKSTSKARGGSEFKNIQIHQTLDVDSIGYDAVELFLKDLVQAFGSTALFFYDRCGGRTITGLWKPAVLGKKEWRVRQGWSSELCPVTEDDPDQGKINCVLNQKSILAEIGALGQGLVKEITAQAGP